MEPNLPPLESIPLPLPEAPKPGFKKSILIQILAVLHILAFIGYFGRFILNLVTLGIGGSFYGYFIFPLVLNLAFLWASITVLFGKNEHRYKIARTILLVGFFLSIILFGLLIFALSTIHW